MTRQEREPSAWTVAFVVAAITLAAYLRTLDFDFTYDDHHHFVQNPFVRDVGNASQLLPWRFFDQEFPDQARPVLVATHFLDRWLGGAASVCHLQSALWHAATAALVFLLARTLGFATRTAGFAGVLFGLHPVLVEAVAAISNREDVLAAFFGLFALLALERVFAGKRLALVGVALGYAIALLSKESALAVPLLAAVLALVSPRFRPRKSPRRAWLGVALAFGLVTLGWAGIQLRLGYPSLLPAAGGKGLERASLVLPLRTLVAWQAPAPGPAAATPRAERRRPQGEISLADAPALEAFRAWQLIAAWPTAPEYDLARFRTTGARLAGALALLLLVAAMLRDLRRRGRFALGIAWFFAASVPVVVPTLLLNPLADRYLYLPAVGVSLTLAWLLAERLPEALRRPNLAGPSMLFASVASFGLTLSGSMVFRDDVALFTRATETAPRSARAQQNLGSALLRAERLDEARVALERAVELDPSLLAPRVNLGLMEEARGRPDLALPHYQHALELPHVVAEQKLRARACERFGVVALRTNRRAEAESVLEQERARAPGSPCAAALERSLGGR